MGSILHANAKTTPRIRKEIQESTESIAILARRYGINKKTVLYWRNASGITDGKSGPKKIRSVLTERDESVICEFRRQTKDSLDDVLIALKGCIPALTRSNLHRCLQRHGLSRLPKEALEKSKKAFKDYLPGYMHVDITQVSSNAGKHYIFVGIDRATKYVYVELYDQMTMAHAVTFLKNLIEDCPFRIVKLLTDNGAQFTYALLAEHLRPREKTHPFDLVCLAHNIEHRLTKFRHPWTNGQVEIMNKIIKDATTKRFYYETSDELKKHLMAFVLFYNYQKKLKAKKLKTPYLLISEFYASNPEIFRCNPETKIVGLNK